jgi:quercetin dioxygenase-like cupin family protein
VIEDGVGLGDWDATRQKDDYAVVMGWIRPEESVARAVQSAGMPSLPDWPDELDALRAAPQHHTLLFENDSVRVLDTTVQPGETVPLHTHCWAAVQYIVSWSDLVRRDADGRVVLDTRDSETKPAAGSSAWLEPLGPHTLENVGERELRVISVELKGQT